MGDNPKFSQAMKLTGHDETHFADVLLQDGVRKLQTTATATVESLFGEVVFPYTWIEVNTVGNNGDSIRIEIPDDGVDVTYVKTASEVTVNDLAKKMRDALNADVTFKALYKSQTPRDSHLFCLSALLIQTVRPDSGDVILTVTGSLTATLAFDTIIDRKISLALFPHPSDCRKGTIGIFGEVNVISSGRPPRHMETMDSGLSIEQNIDGSSTPVLFKLSNNPDYIAQQDQDLIVTEL